MLERRQLLGSAAFGVASSLAGIGPRLDAHQPPRPEPKLEAAFARFMASRAAAMLAEDRARAAYDAVDRPDLPAAALCQPGDFALELTNNVWDAGIRVGEVYRNCPALRHAALMTRFYAPGEPQHAAAVRAEEILAALQWHTDAVSRAERDGDYAAADRAEVESLGIERRDAEALAREPSDTLEGVMLKARAIALYERNAEALQDWRDEAIEHHCPCTQLAVSICFDLIRMAANGPVGQALPSSPSPG